jgi:hypothetical protein
MRLVEEMSEIFDKYPVAMNTTVMGGGKTNMTGVLAVKRGLRLAIICPANLLDWWNRFFSENKIDPAFALSYNMVRGTKGNGVSHQYLRREDGPKGPTFEPETDLLKLLDAGLLLVFDEASCLKNDVDQFRACLALLKPIHEAGVSGKSRAVLLSAFPFNEKAHAINFLRLLGQAEEDNPGRILARAQELNCEEADKLANKFSPLFIRGEPARAGVAWLEEERHSFYFEVLLHVVRPLMVRALPADDIDIAVEKDVANGFYPLLSLKDELELADAVRELSRITRYNDKNREVCKQGIGKVTKILRRVETAMRTLFAHLIRRDLESDTPYKVIMCVNYLETLGWLVEQLRDYSPLILSGGQSTAERTEAIRLFQNSPDFRLLLCTPQTGGIGVSLHDSTGEWPRRLYISPNYSIMLTHQITGRVYRKGTLSTPYIRVVYGIGEARQCYLVRILDAMARQSANAAAFLDQQSADGVLFPGQYPADFSSIGDTKF